MTFADLAIADYQAATAAAEAAAKAAADAARADLVAAARVSVVPALTTFDKKVALDPKLLVASEVNVDGKWVVLSSPDLSVHLLVQGSSVRFARQDGGAWVPGAPVTRLADVGEVLT